MEILQIARAFFSPSPLDAVQTSFYQKASGPFNPSVFAKERGAPLGPAADGLVWRGGASCTLLSACVSACNFFAARAAGMRTAAGVAV